MLLDWVSFLVHPNLFEIKSFVVVVLLYDMAKFEQIQCIIMFQQIPTDLMFDFGSIIRAKIR
jgi:hypothetical protein